MSAASAHALSLTGRSPAADSRRGAVKANLIHHLAHAGDERVFRRIGRACVSPRDWVPASLRSAPPPLVEAFDAALDPDWAWGWMLCGEIKRVLIDYDGAAKDLRKASAMDPS